MNTLKICLLSLFALMCVNVNATPTNIAQQQFDFISQLKGDWKLSPADQQEGKTTQHKIVKPLIGSDRVAISFKLIGKGSAMQESLLPGTKKEMATMYHCDNFGKCRQVLATHYCAKKNQPVMIAEPVLSSNSINMQCDKNSSLCNSDKGHVHNISHELSADNMHLKATYTVFKNGKYKKDSIYHFDRIN